MTTPNEETKKQGDHEKIIIEKDSVAKNLSHLTLEEKNNENISKPHELKEL